MQIEVIQLSKIEKATEKGIVNVHKAVLKGMGYVKSHETGETIAVQAKVTLECEEDASALDNFIRQAIGDIRELSLSPINHRLDEFVKPKIEA